MVVVKSENAYTIDHIGDVGGVARSECSERGTFSIVGRCLQRTLPYYRESSCLVSAGITCFATFKPHLQAMCACFV